MASTDSTNVLQFGQYGPTGTQAITYGVDSLSTGEADVDTGLSEVFVFVATPVSSTTDTVKTVVNVKTDIPDNTPPGTVTVRGSLINEANDAVAVAGSEQFNWIAIGKL